MTLEQRVRELEAQVNMLARRLLSNQLRVGSGRDSRVELGFDITSARDFDDLPRLIVDLSVGPVANIPIQWQPPGGSATSIVTLGFETDGYVWTNGGAAEVVKCTWDETTVPTVNDDSGDGFAIRSLWLDVSADHAYMCLDATAGAAVWRLLTEAIAVVPAAAGFNAPIPIGLGQAG